MRSKSRVKKSGYRQLGNILIVVGVLIALTPLWTNLYTYIYQYYLQEDPAIEIPEDLDPTVPLEFTTAFWKCPHWMYLLL
jgi:hypothetical protein